MDSKTKITYSEHYYRIIREIENNPHTTQRALATKLEVSLGKINFIINALIKKGIIEVKNFKNAKNKLGYMYLLTPRGMRIKYKLFSTFLQWKIQEYERLAREIEQMKKEVPAQDISVTAQPQDGW